MRKIFLVMSILVGGCTLHVTDTMRDAQMSDLLSRVQRLETGKADASLVGQALQQRDQQITDLRAKMDAQSQTTKK